jgi:F-type H+-transporting ATPase subunit a
VLIEIISFFFVKPVSHFLRLFANMLAGHIALKVFASFVGIIGTLGLIGWIGAIFPLALTVALTALELLVAFLQAYVFAILTCIYLNDAIHPGHCFRWECLLWAGLASASHLLEIVVVERAACQRSK